MSGHPTYGLVLSFELLMVYYVRTNSKDLFMVGKTEAIHLVKVNLDTSRRIVCSPQTANPFAYIVLVQLERPGLRVLIIFPTNVCKDPRFVRKS